MTIRERFLAAQGYTIAYDVHQFSGAMGLTLEYPLHLYTYRARMLLSEYGGAHTHIETTVNCAWPCPNNQGSVSVRNVQATSGELTRSALPT